MAEIRYLKLWLHQPGQPEGSKLHIGYLSQYSDIYRLSFTPEYIDNPQRLVLGQAFVGSTPQATRDILSADTDPRVFSINRPPNYFRNLLPEGHNKERLASQRGCAVDDEFELLAAAGHDFFGAVELSPLAQSEQIAPQVHRAHVTGLAHEPVSAGFVDTPMDSAMSLPGVVAKFSAVQDGRRYVVNGSQRAGQSVIIKLPSTRHPDLVHNEMVGYQLCAAVGIDCARAQVVPRSLLDLPEHVPFAQALVVERFDRNADGTRIHMEEFIQAYQREPRLKYGADFDTEFTMLLATVNAASGAAFLDASQVLRRFVAFVLMGNTDAHAKNWALLYPDGVSARLAPVYDPVCVTALFAQVASADYAINRAIDAKMRHIDWPALEALVKRAGFLNPKPLLKVAKATVAAAKALWPALLQSAPADVQREVLGRLNGGVALSR
jgi:serine/threonine-protein kinase HipA